MPYQYAQTTKRFVVELDHDHQAMLQQLSKSYQMNASYVVRQLIREAHRKTRRGKAKVSTEVDPKDNGRAPHPLEEYESLTGN